MAKVYHASTRSDWGTPSHIIDLARWLCDIDDFDMDACATARNAKADLYITPEMDALSVDWVNFIQDRGGNPLHTWAWSNPPYQRRKPNHEDFFHYAERQSRGGLTICMLLACRTSTKLWWEIIDAGYPTAQIHGRVTFEGATQGAGFPSVLVLVGYERTWPRIGWRHIVIGQQPDPRYQDGQEYDWLGIT